MGLSIINKKKALIIGVFILMGIVLAAPSYALEISVKEQATVSGETIQLSDIAFFHPKDDARVEQLGEIDVASAPTPGKEFTLNKRFLHYRLGSLINNNSDIDVKIPANITIKRTANFIDSSELEEMFKDHITDNFPWPADKLVFERIKVPETLALPEGDLEWEVFEKGNAKYLGNVALKVNFKVDGKQVRTVTLSGKTSLRQKMVKAARRIRRGQFIREGDLRVVFENTRRAAIDVITSPDEAIGKKAVRGIQPGQSITAEMLVDPPLVKKGKRVIIIAQNKFLRATTLGKVLEDGRAGEQIRVTNIGSGKEVLATVTGPGVVEVYF